MDIEKRAKYMKRLHEDTRATIEQQVLRQVARINTNKKENEILKYYKPPKFVQNTPQNL
jgi:hypothetical protein